MFTSTLMNDCLAPLLQGLGPLDRLGAARGRFSGSSGASGTGWIWLVLGVVLLAIAAAAVAYFVIRLHKRSPSARQPAPGPSSFDRYADQAALSQEERSLLEVIATLAGLKRPESVFMLGAAFDKGAARFAEGDELAGMPEEARKVTLARLESLRQKLGHHDVGESRQTRPAGSRQIPVGTRLLIVDGPGSGGFETAVAANTDEGMEIEPEMPIECNPGETWLIRYEEGGKVWQFDARVLKNRKGRIVLAHTKRVRFHDRRRYPRRSVHRSAYVAKFPFVKDGSERQSPRLLKASLVEVAGPGLKLESPLSVQPEDNVLVALKLGDGRAVQGFAKVRRVLDEGEGKSLFAVELIGLKDDEVAELARGMAEPVSKSSDGDTAAQPKEAEAAALRES